MIELACCIDDGFTMPCGVTITSICENNEREELRFHVIFAELSPQNQESLKEIALKYHREILFHKIDASSFAGFPVSYHIKIATYFRILLPYILSVDIDKVLYLDCDLLVRGNLAELWEQDITGFAVGVVRDAVSSDIRYYNRLQYDICKGYFNAGVLLINLQYWREKDIAIKVLNFIREFPDRCESWDQDGLNYVLQDEKKWLPMKYNVQTAFYFDTSSLLIDRIFWVEINEAIRNPLILHYTYGIKPWMQNCNHPYRNEYLNYLYLTKWRCVKIYPGIMARFMKSVKRMLLTFLRVMPPKANVFKNVPLTLEKYVQKN